MANEDLERCNRSLANTVRSADRVVRKEQKRNADCEEKLRRSTAECFASQRALNTTIAMMERRVVAAEGAEKAGARSELEARALREENEALRVETAELASRVRSLERERTHRAIQTEDKIRRLAKKVEHRTWLAWELGAVAVAAAVAWAAGRRRGAVGRGRPPSRRRQPLQAQASGETWGAEALSGAGREERAMLQRLSSLATATASMATVLDETARGVEDEVTSRLETSARERTTATTLDHAEADQETTTRTRKKKKSKNRRGKGKKGRS